ncbi:MAG: diguanylate cyclase [Acidobacteria bacterium]|nr:diguanylate cyclase [Acidobacteriota bacterium]
MPRGKTRRNRWIAIVGVVAGMAILIPGLTAGPTPPLSALRHESWGKENGIPSNLWGVAQTLDGYLWLASDDGLVRFDGVRGVCFNRQNVPAMSMNLVSGVLAARDGSLYAAILSGGLLRCHQGEFRTWTSRDGLPGDTVTALAEGTDGSVWIGTLNGGLARLWGGALSVHRGGKGQDTLPAVSALCPDGSGGLWIGTLEGLFHFEGGRLNRCEDKEGMPPVLVRAITLDRQGRLWVATHQNGLYCREGGLFRNVGADAGLPSRLASLREDRRGRLWIGTIHDGIFCLSDGRLDRFAPDAIKGLWVRGICEDREGALWFALPEGGLHRLRDAAVATYGATEGLPAFRVRGLFCGPDGVLRAAGPDGVFRFLPGSDGPGGPGREGVPSPVAGGARFVPEGRWPSRSVHALSLAMDKSNRLWAGTKSGELYLLRGQAWQPVPLHDLRAAFSITALLAEGDGMILGCYGQSRMANLYRIDTPGARPVALEFEGLPRDASVTTLARDRSGALWVATFGSGLFRVEGGRAVRYHPGNGLASDYVLTLFEDDRGDLWVGTVDGLNRVRGGKAQGIPGKSPLAREAIAAVIADDSGHLWFGTPGGLFRCAAESLRRVADGMPAPLELAVFNESDGMRSASCNGGFNGAACRMPDGTLCFSTEAGVAMVDPARLPRNPHPPPVVVESMEADRLPVPLVPGRTDVLNIAEGRRDFAFRYTALSLLVPARVRFRYRLEGYDRGWIDAEDRREAYYTNLGPGRYAFRVTACNNDGVWNEAGDTVTFEIQPRFDQTAGFRAGIAVAVGFLVILLFRLHTRRVRRGGEELEQRIRDRTRELDEALAQLGREHDTLRGQSHTDPLTGLPDRDRMMDTLTREWERARESLKPVSLILADLDDFALYNAHNGRDNGDACLRKVGNTVRDCAFRAYDLAGRFADDRFGVALAETGLEEARVVAERIRAAVESLGIPHPGSRVTDHLTVSLGVASLVPTPRSDPEDLVAQAEQALFRAKAAGRNRLEALPAEGSP